MATKTTGTAPRLVAVVATTHPWPSAQRCLESLIQQAEECGAHVLLACASEAGAPPEGYAVEVMVRPGASVFELRAAATNAARGELVSWTEDHCIPDRDWCRGILAAHAANPEAMVIAGPVRNGSMASMADWANFLVTFGPFLGEGRGRGAGRIPPAANVSFRREALPESARACEIELEVLPRLWKQGGVWLREGAGVRHEQSFGLLRTPVVHFHNGRVSGGTVSERLGVWGKVARAAACALLPAEILRTSVAGSLGTPGVPWVRCLGYMGLLAASHAAGELTGLLSGRAGRSPWAIE